MNLLGFSSTYIKGVVRYFDCHIETLNGPVPVILYCLN